MAFCVCSQNIACFWGCAWWWLQQAPFLQTGPSTVALSPTRPAPPPQLPYSRLKDTWMKISLVTKEVDELGAIIKIACRQGVQVALYL